MSIPSGEKRSGDGPVDIGPPPYYHRSDCNICRKQDNLKTGSKLLDVPRPGGYMVEGEHFVAEHAPPRPLGRPPGFWRAHSPEAREAAVNWPREAIREICQVSDRRPRHERPDAAASRVHSSRQCRARRARRLPAIA